MAERTFEFVVATLSEREHAVFVVHNDTPEWYRLVATFTNRARAVDYAEMEDTLADDFDEPLADREQDKEPAPQGLPPAPAPGLVEGFHRVTQHTRIEETAVRQVAEREGHSELSDNIGRLPQRVRAALPPVVDESPAPIAKVVHPEAPPKASEPAEKPNGVDENPAALEIRPVDAATLPLLTAAESRVLKALIELRAKTTGHLSLYEVAKTADCARSSINAMFYALEKKGFVKNVGKPLVPDYQPLCFGEPRETEGRHPDKKKEDEADVAIAEERIRAIENGTEKLVSLDELKAELDKPPSRPAPIKPVPLPKGPAPQTVDPDHATLDDLNHRARNLLVALVRHPNDIDAAVKASLVEDEKRVAFLLARLKDFGCIALVGAHWTPTDVGLDLAKQIGDIKPLEPVPQPAKPRVVAGAGVKVPEPILKRAVHTDPIEAAFAKARRGPRW